MKTLFQWTINTQNQQIKISSSLHLAPQNANKTHLSRWKCDVYNVVQGRRLDRSQFNKFFAQQIVTISPPPADISSKQRCDSHTMRKLPNQKLIPIWIDLRFVLFFYMQTNSAGSVTRIGYKMDLYSNNVVKAASVQGHTLHMRSDLKHFGFGVVIHIQNYVIFAWIKCHLQLQLRMREGKSGLWAGAAAAYGNGSNKLPSNWIQKMLEIIL